MKMKLTIKNLKQISYPIEISESHTVMQLKEEIEKNHGFDSKSIKLLFNGVILDDSKGLQEYQIKEGMVIMMMNAKAKPQNIIKEEEKKVEEVLPKKEVVNKTESKKPFQIENQKDYTKEIQQLNEMGFTEDLARRAIEAAKGNLEIAIEYLYNGIPEAAIEEDFLGGEEEEGEGEEFANIGAALNELDLNSPETIKSLASIVKIIIQEDPEQLSTLLENIEDSNPEVIDYIKQYEEQFRNLINTPVTDQDIEIFEDLVGGNIQDEGELGNEQMEQILNQVGLNQQNQQNLPNQNLTNQNLTFSQNEKESIDRLMGLGFSQEEVVQAFIACDKNETAAANFLVDSKYKDDMNIDYDASDFYDDQSPKK